MVFCYNNLNELTQCSIKSYFASQLCWKEGRILEFGTKEQWELADVDSRELGPTAGGPSEEAFDHMLA